MDLTPFKITAEDRKKGVKSAPDTLTGTAQQNKAIFDNFPDGFADKYNLATDALQGFGNVTQSHLDNTANPHKTTKAQVGLSLADNTADANKPVSTPQAAALLKKTDKTTQDPINQGFTNDIARLNTEKTDKATQNPINQGFAADVARLEAGKTDKTTQDPINQTVADALQTLDSGKASTSYVDSRDGKTYQDAKDYADSLAFSAGAVLSVFGRAGAVVAKTGDYTAAMVGAEPTGNAAAAVATHNTAAGTHNDIRNLTTTHNASSTAHTDIRNLTTAHNVSATAHADIRNLTANHIAATDLHTNALTHSKSGTIHTLSGTIPTAAYYTARFKAAANFVAGDTFKIGTTVYTGTLTNSNDALPDELFLTGKVLTVEVDTAGKKINFVGGGGSVGGFSFPTYTGNKTFFGTDKQGYMELYTSGTLTATSNIHIDAFLVGGGAGGRVAGYAYKGGGGGGGYTTTVKNLALEKGKTYPITIAGGGAEFTAGGSTTAFGHTVLGGAVNSTNDTGGGHGGSGGGGGSEAANSGNGGSNGGNGMGGAYGTGQGRTTKAFEGDIAPFTNMLFSGGGGAARTNASEPFNGGVGGGGSGGYVAAGTGFDGVVNSGGGGGGSHGAGKAGKGGSGIVIIRWGY